MKRPMNRLLNWIAAAVVVAVVAACGEQPPVATDNTLSVSIAGTGSGTVVSVPVGIDASAVGTVTADFAAGTEVELIAQAAMGSTFAGWSGACTGTDATCAVTLDDDTSVTATFTADAVVEGPFDLTVQKAGGGEGTVTSDVGGIDLPVGESTDTAFDLEEDTVVTLTATPDGTSVFAGWSGGGCTGTATTCVVTMTADTTVTATFTAPGEVTQSFTILAESDDAEEYVNAINASFPAGSVDTGSSDLDLTFDEAVIPGTSTDRGEVVVGLRFANVTVPQGSQITSATITFTLVPSFDIPIRGTTTFQIHGQASDDAGTFVYEVGVGNNDISGRPTTVAVADWTQGSTIELTVETSDLAAVVQEIVDRGGWASGNALAFVITSNGSDANNRVVVESFESGAPPVLEVAYTAP